MNNKVLIIAFGALLFVFNILFGFVVFPVLAWLRNPNDFQDIVIPGSIILSFICSMVLLFISTNDKMLQGRKKFRFGIFLYFLVSTTIGIALGATRYGGLCQK